MVINNEPKIFNGTPRTSQIARKSVSRELTESRFFAKIAQTSYEIESALRLRYEVFNVELSAAYQTESAVDLDCDEFDTDCKHLLILDRICGKTVGTYRLNSIETAKDLGGFYAFNEFSIEDLPSEILRQSVEVGRACIAREYRNSKVLFLLWQSLIDYLQFSQKRYFFGCCSIFTQDYDLGARTYQYFKRCGFVHSELKVKPRRERAFSINQIYESKAEQVELPSLFNLYLKIGAKVCGEPAIDGEFGTIDFFVIFDLHEMSEKYQKMFLGDNKYQTQKSFV